MQGNKVDYHIHTTCSDGASTPAQIIKQAKELQYDEIAITDHDNVEGWAEAKIAAEAVEMKIITGIEIATETEEGIGLHILGYRFDPECEELKEFLAEMLRRRDERNERLIAELQDMGYDITFDDLETGKNHFIGKPVIARAMEAKGYIGNMKEAFGREILGSDRCRAIKKEKPLTAEAIGIIAAAGGIPVLAHPIQTRGIGQTGSEEFFQNIEKIIARLKKQGLKGLECFHPDQNEEQSARFVELAEKYHLHITRGSDFHGEDFSKADPTAAYR
ncbi:MAG: PHP domain-containing protein [Firmicutes bacterium]|nr:PHP domain-containing protein [Bacillota bacterium]